MIGRDRREKLYAFTCTLLCSTLCDPLNCSPPDPSVHGILQARILEWIAISFSTFTQEAYPKYQLQKKVIEDIVK